MFSTDSCAFLNLPGSPPCIQCEEGYWLPNLLCLPSTPFETTSTERFLRAHCKFIETLSREGIVSIIEDSEHLDAILKIDNGVGALLSAPYLPHDIDFTIPQQDVWDKRIKIVGATYSGDINLSIEDFLNWCVKRRVIIDFSYGEYERIRQLLGAIKDSSSASSVFASHSACFDRLPHHQNLPDDILRGIADKGGVVGIPTVTYLLSEKDDSLDPFVEHVQRALRVCGENGVCMGSGGVYRNTPLPKAQIHFEYHSTPNMRFPNHPQQLIEWGSRRIEHLWYELQKVLLPRIVEKVMGENLLEFFKRAL